MASPCFIALSRPVSFMGLPMTYVILLSFIVFGGFIGSGSFTYLGLSGALGYLALRGLAAYDPRALDVIFVALTKTPPPPSVMRGEGAVYHA